MKLIIKIKCLCIPPVFHTVFSSAMLPMDIQNRHSSLSKTISFFLRKSAHSTEYSRVYPHISTEYTCVYPHILQNIHVCIHTFLQNIYICASTIQQKPMQEWAALLWCGGPVVLQKVSVLPQEGWACVAHTR